MSDQPPLRRDCAVVALAVGTAVGSWRCHGGRRRRVEARSPLIGLTARQAMIAVAFGRIVGNASMLLFVLYYVAVMWRIGW